MLSISPVFGSMVRAETSGSNPSDNSQSCFGSVGCGYFGSTTTRHIILESIIRGESGEIEKSGVGQSRRGRTLSTRLESASSRFSDLILAGARRRSLILFVGEIASLAEYR